MHGGQGDYRPHKVRPVRMSRPVLRRTPVTHTRLAARVQRRHELQVVAAHESLAAAIDLVHVEIEVGDSTRGSGRVVEGGVAVTVDRAGRAEGVEVLVVPSIYAGR